MVCPRQMAIVLGLVGVTAVAGLASTACSRPSGDARKARPADPNAGRIHGLVTLRGEAPPLELEPTGKDTDTCGVAVNVTRLDLGKDNGVAQTFVYLDGVPSSEELLPRASTQVAQQGCSYGPHVLTLETGTDLEFVNNDPILHSAHARQGLAGEALQTVFNLAQPVQGQRTKVDTALEKPGIVALQCEAGHPWMTAYILVTGHPYVATTDENGEFAIDNVPAGTYSIKMWHEGVRLKRFIESMEKYEYEDPYEATQQVVVPAKGEAVANFSFEARRAP